MTGKLDLLDRLLASHGDARPDVAKLLLWSNHVAAAVAVLREVERDLRNPANLAQFRRRGWWRRATKRNHRGQDVRIPEEDAISDALIERIQQLQERPRHGSAVAANRRLRFHSQQRRRRQEGIGPQGRKNTDITVYGLDEVCLDLRIEAKVLFEAADVSREYGSQRGLLRYADPVNPYTIEIIGGMLAYCLTEDLTEWAGRLEAALASVEEVAAIATVTMPGEPNGILCCDVANTGAVRKVTVFHLGLEFDTDPVSRSGALPTP